MKVAAFLPAKGSSDRISNKNTMLLDGEPLFLRSLKKLVVCKSIDEVFLDTESLDIIEIASEVDCKILKRDPLLASNKTDGNQLFLNEVNNSDADICLQLLCTSPFIKIETIEKSIEILKNSSEFDSVVAIRREKLYTWKNNKPSYDISRIPNSVDLDDTTIEAMGLYVVRRETALKTGRRIGNNPYLIEIDPIESVDVNWPADFEMANLIAVGLRERERCLLHNLKFLLSSALLSDILDDMKISSVLSNVFQLNIPDQKILGRAKTMQIVECKNDDYRKIYDGLKLYETVISNDVIVVANTVPNYAFFGELNANLAIRSGAIGAIIDGVTRDTQAVSNIGFPVFSKGNYCKDTKQRGIVSSRNKRIYIDNICIQKDDLVFGDKDGVVIIPKNQEDLIIREALERAKNEKNILIDIAKGTSTDELVTRYGLF